jgi:hypothetical protein
MRILLAVEFGEPFKTVALGYKKLNCNLRVDTARCEIWYWSSRWRQTANVTTTGNITPITYSADLIEKAS